jgi:hypothetical protein
MAAMTPNHEGIARLSVGDLVVAFDLSDTITLRNLEIRGVLRDQLSSSSLARLARAFEGAPLDASTLQHVAKRAFQENEIAVPGVRPEDVVRAILSA